VTFNAEQVITVVSGTQDRIEPHRNGDNSMFSE
jgi:hypothetical protein